MGSVSAVKLAEKPFSGELTFDVGVKIDEKERKSGKTLVEFILTIKTRPSVVKFGIEGFATLTGKDEDIEKMLEIDPESKIPRLLDKIYRHVFTAVYLLSTVIDSPYPPSNLFSSKLDIPNVEMLSDVSAQTVSQPQAETTSETKEPKPQ
ncbi:MAG: hypothetical protein QXJ02_03540 [Candidatus Bathyarchaeia archaeon]